MHGVSVVVDYSEYFLFVTFQLCSVVKCRVEIYFLSVHRVLLAHMLDCRHVNQPACSTSLATR